MVFSCPGPNDSLSEMVFMFDFALVHCKWSILEIIVFKSEFTAAPFAPGFGRLRHYTRMCKSSMY